MKIDDTGKEHVQRSQRRNDIDDFDLNDARDEYYSSDDYYDEGDDDYYDSEDDYYDQEYDYEDADLNEYNAPGKQELQIDVTISEKKRNDINPEVAPIELEIIPKKVDNDMESSDFCFSS